MCIKSLTSGGPADWAAKFMLSKRSSKVAWGSSGAQQLFLYHPFEFFWILLIYFQFLFCKLLGHFEHLEPEPREWLRAWQGWLAVCAVAACAIIALCYARSMHSLPDRRKGSFGHLWGCRVLSCAVVCCRVLSCAVVQTGSMVRATSQRGCEFRIFRGMITV